MSWSEDALVAMMEASHGSPITLREIDAEKGPPAFAVCIDERRRPQYDSNGLADEIG